MIKHHNSLTWQLWLRYGFYVGTVHGAAVLQAGGGDAQGGVVLPGLQGAGQGDFLDHLPRRYLLAGVQHLVRVGQDQLKREVAGVALRVQQRHLYGLLVGRQADRRIAGNLDADCLAAVGGFVRQLIARPCAGALLQIRGEGVLLLAAGKLHARQYRCHNDHHRRDNADYNVFFLQHDAALFLFAETRTTSGTNRHCIIILTGSKTKNARTAYFCVVRVVQYFSCFVPKLRQGA